jgi:hypothetical protein
MAYVHGTNAVMPGHRKGNKHTKHKMGMIDSMWDRH